MHQCHHICCRFSSPKKFSNAETSVGFQRQVLNYSGNLLFCQSTWYFQKSLYKWVCKPRPPISFLPLSMTTPLNEFPCFLCLQNVDPWQAVSITPAISQCWQPSSDVQHGTLNESKQLGSVTMTSRGYNLEGLIEVIHFSYQGSNIFVDKNLLSLPEEHILYCRSDYTWSVKWCKLRMDHSFNN